MLELAIDGKPLVRPATGIGRYTTELLAALTARHPEVVPTVVFAATDVPRTDVDAAVRRATAAGLRVHEVPAGRQRIAELAGVLALPWPRYPRLAGHASPAWLFPHFRAFPTPGARSVAVVHDLAAWAVPDALPAGYRLKVRRYVASALRFATAIATPSAAVAAEVHARWPQAAERVFVLRPGRVQALPDATPPDTDEILARLGVLPGYLLHVGDLGARKNLDALLAVLDAGVLAGQRLVLVGPRPAGDAPIAGRLRALGGRVQHLGYLPDDELRAVYARATALVFPTRYEGFGFPVLEAMALGVPVACSDLPVLREVGGDAVATFDAGDARDVAATLGRLVSDDAWRAELTERGRTRAATFTWDVGLDRLVARLWPAA